MADKSGTRGVRTTVIALRDHNNNLVAPFRFEGYTNKEVFKQYLREVALPQLLPDQVMILDNAKFHKGEDIRKLVESAGHKLKYLPTYSPDLNPIEKKWAQLKKLYRKWTYRFKDKLELLDGLLRAKSYQQFC